MVKWACVTGADRGLGFYLTRTLLERGFHVVAGHYQPNPEQLLHLKRENPDKLHTVRQDISDSGSVKQAAEEISSLTDRLDLLINNAAVLGDIDATIFEELDFAEIQQVFNVNTLGPLRVTNALIPLLEKGETKLIVNISSEAGSVGDSYREAWFGYCMSKSALNMQSTIVHNRFKKNGGQVLVVHPGWMKTNMRGETDNKAPLTAEESARHICVLIDNRETYRGDKPAYIDYSGQPLPW